MLSGLPSSSSVRFLLLSYLKVMRNALWAPFPPVGFARRMAWASASARLLVSLVSLDHTNSSKRLRVAKPWSIHTA